MRLRAWKCFQSFVLLSARDDRLWTEQAAVVFWEAALEVFSCPGVGIVGGGEARNIASISAVGVGVGWGVEEVIEGDAVAMGGGVARGTTLGTGDGRELSCVGAPC